MAAVKSKLKHGNIKDENLVVTVDVQIIKSNSKKPIKCQLHLDQNSTSVTLTEFSKIWWTEYNTFKSTLEKTICI